MLVAALTLSSLPFAPTAVAATSIPLQLPWPSAVQHDIDAGNSYGCNTHTGRDYYAIDFALPSGSAVSAVAAGTAHTVAQANSGGYGNMVWVDHGSGIVSLYGHLGSFSVSDGQAVGQGQLLGYSDNTGNSTGPHLHFVMRQGATTWYDGSALQAEPMSGYTGFGGYGLHLGSTPACGVNAVSPMYTSRAPSGGGLPAAPTNLTATAVSSSSIRLNWQDNATTETSYQVLWWNGSSWVLIGILGANVTAATVGNLQPSHTYNYLVCAHNSAGNACAARYATATTQAAPATTPAAPSNLTATALSSSSIRLSWRDNSSNETSFQVQWWNGSSWVLIGYLGANVTSADVGNLAASHTYRFNVCSHNAAGTSCAASYATVTTLSALVTIPAAPTNIRATATNTSSIHVTWTDNSGNESGFRVSDNISTVTVGANTTSFDWTGLSGGTYKCTHVQAFNSAGSSAWTDWGCTTTPTSGYADVVVDDQSGGFVRAGTSAYWHESTGGYNNHFWWTYTNASGVDDRAMWTPNLPSAGNWQVFVYVPSVNATTTNARYRIDHNGSQTTVSVNQNNYYNAWVSLGTYYFPAGGGPNAEVFMGDETYEASTHQIAFDAVKWVWVGP